MIRLFLTSSAILALDIISKAATCYYFQPWGDSSLAFPFGGVAIFQLFGIDFCIHHVTNRGIAWGIGESWQELILGFRIVLILGLLVYLVLSKKPPFQRYALALLTVGGVGNILDYFIYGHVIDMFHLIFWGYSYPVFNVADIAIFCGIMALLWQSFKRKDAPLQT